MDIIDVLILGPEMYGFLAMLAIVTFPLVLLFFIVVGNRKELKKTYRFNELMKNPEFAEKQTKKSLNINRQTGIISIFSYALYNIDEDLMKGTQWLVSKESIIVKKRFEAEKEIPFDAIHKIAIKELQNFYTHGSFVTLWKSKPEWWAKGLLAGFSRRLISEIEVKPFQMEAAYEIKRRHDEYINQQ